MRMLLESMQILLIAKMAFPLCIYCKKEQSESLLTVHPYLLPLLIVVMAFALIDCYRIVLIAVAESV